MHLARKHDGLSCYRTIRIAEKVVIKNNADFFVSLRYRFVSHIAKNNMITAKISEIRQGVRS